MRKRVRCPACARDILIYTDSYIIYLLNFLGERERLAWQLLNNGAPTRSILAHIKTSTSSRKKVTCLFYARGTKETTTVLL